LGGYGPRGGPPPPPPPPPPQPPAFASVPSVGKGSSKMHLWSEDFPFIFLQE